MGCEGCTRHLISTDLNQKDICLMKLWGLGFIPCIMDIYCFPQNFQNT